MRPKAKKTSVINFRVSEQDKTEITEEATRFNMSVSQYMMMLHKQKNIVVIEGGRELAQELYNFHKEINQRKHEQFIKENELQDLVSQEIMRIRRKSEEAK